jgi:putative phosphoribosyl transferase
MEPIFINRTDAGRQLTVLLKKFEGKDVVLLAVPRGGVPVAYEVAKEMGWPLDIMLTKKLGHPKQKEYAIGAVGLEDSIIVPHTDVSEEYIIKESKRVRERLKHMRQIFMGNQPAVQVRGKTVILIDDGIATGHTVLAAVQILRKQHPAKIVVAVPVASARAIESLSEEADEMVVVQVPEVFYGVGQFYQDFTQVSDEEVIKDLQQIKSA